MTPLQQIGAGRLPHGVDDLVGLEWLEKVVLNPAAVNGINRILEPAETGHHDANSLWRMEADMFEQLDATLTGQLLIGQDNIDGTLRQNGPSRFGRFAAEKLEFGSQQLAQQAPDGRLVIDDQDRATITAHGPDPYGNEKGEKPIRLQRQYNSYSCARAKRKRRGVAESPMVREFFVIFLR